MNNSVEKAETIQSAKAYLIPTCLFLSCLITAAGMFIVYSGNTVGFAFIIVGATIMISAFVAFVRFHNKLRADGQFKGTGARPEGSQQE